MDPESSAKPISKNMEMLWLSSQQLKRWPGIRYLVVIEVQNIREVEPFGFYRKGFSNMDDWFPVGDIEKGKK